MKPAPLYKINDRRSVYGGGGSRLFDAGAPSGSDVKRAKRRFPRTDYDTRGNVSEWGWRELLSASRYLVANFGPIREAVWQMASYAVGMAFNVQYKGRNKAWGDQMEEALYYHDQSCDVRGGPFDFRTSLILDLVSIIRDGDASCILADVDGMPRYQSIPAHRIGYVPNGGETVKGGRYDGRQICNGVILDDYQRPLAYRVFNSMGADDYTDVPAGSMFQDYRPEFCDQSRGLPWLSAAIYDAADIMDLRGFLKTALKAESSITLVEHNEAGTPMSIGSALVPGAVTTTDDGNSTVNPSVEYFDDNTVRYFRAGTSSKIEAPNSQRPSQNAQDFSFEILRSAFGALGWPIEFHNPESLGGANIRMRVAQAMRTIEALQAIARRIAKRKHTYTISKKIQNGELPPDADWYKIDHQLPRELTVDNGRDIKAELELYRVGGSSLNEICGAFGDNWEKVLEQKAKEAAKINELAAKYGVEKIDIQLMTQFSAFAAAQDKQNGGGQPAAQPMEDEPDDEEEPESEDDDESN